MKRPFIGSVWDPAYLNVSRSEQRDRATGKASITRESEVDAEEAEQIVVISVDDNGNTKRTLMDNTTIESEEGEARKPASKFQPIYITDDEFKEWLPTIQRSELAKENGISNILPKAYYKNARYILENVVLPLRAQYPDLKINSWYRCEKLNAALYKKNNPNISDEAASKFSHHMTGAAVDLSSDSLGNAELFFECGNEFRFRELIWEYGDEKSPAWVHYACYPDGRMSQPDFVKVIGTSLPRDMSVAQFKSILREEVRYDVG